MAAKGEQSKQKVAGSHFKLLLYTSLSSLLQAPLEASLPREVMCRLETRACSSFVREEIKFMCSSLHRFVPYRHVLHLGCSIKFTMARVASGCLSTAFSVDFLMRSYTNLVDSG